MFVFLHQLYNITLYGIVYIFIQYCAFHVFINNYLVGGGIEIHKYVNVKLLL